VLGDDLGGELTETETLTRSLVIVEFLDKLGETAVDEGLAGDLGVILGKHELPFTRLLLVLF
jgi:hypothetical protein